MFLPGDNDIGGEFEPLNVRKLEKFQETFKQPDVLHIGFIDMFKVRHYILLCQRFYNPFLWVLVYVFFIKL